MGHVLSGNGIQIGTDKVAAIQ